MGEDANSDTLTTGLARALARAGMAAPERLERLTGGATMESWRFASGDEPFVLRRAPSAAMMQGRPFGHAVEAAIIRAVEGRGVRAPEIAIELEPADGLGSGFVMRALPGTPHPRTILSDNAGDAEGRRLCVDIAGELAAIHAVAPDDLPSGIPTLDPTAGVTGLREQFEAAGGDRPLVSLALRWLREHSPAPAESRLVHGDYRLGNLLVEGGELTGVLDWELAHLGDGHEDLAYACLTVWRFARIDRPALGLGSLNDWLDAYSEASGAPVDRERFRFWLIYRTCWWALGCLRMGETWRGGADRTLERAVISRRTSEQELDLLMLLEGDAPEAERDQPLPPSAPLRDTLGEATAGDLATAVADWLETIKHRVGGHDRFQIAVARNALGIIARDDAARVDPGDAALARALLAGERTLAEPGLLATLRRSALDKLTIDVPKYPALAEARRKWKER